MEKISKYILHKKNHNFKSGWSKQSKYISNEKSREIKIKLLVEINRNEINYSSKKVISNNIYDENSRRT